MRLAGSQKAYCFACFAPSLSRAGHAISGRGPIRERRGAYAFSGANLSHSSLAAAALCACLALQSGCTTDATIATLRATGEATTAGSAGDPGADQPLPSADARDQSSPPNDDGSAAVLLRKPTANAALVSTGANGCVAGHYVGSFSGTYNSAAWGNGSLTLNIEAVDANGQPGLEFWLEAIDVDCGDAEFCPDFTVKGGKIRGFANPFSDANQGDGAPDAGSEGFAIAVRFEIDFGGDLDCSTGQYRGLLQNGCYDVATVLFRFEGEAPATYNHAATRFENGEWSVKELANPGAVVAPDPNIGGMGVWDAALAPDGARPVDAAAGLCHD